MGKITEYFFSINDFQKPKTVFDKDAIYILLIRLILLEPGTIQSHPKMGVGIVSRYRYSDTQNLVILKQDIVAQISVYLPDLIATDITVTEGIKSIIIQITIEGTTYELTFNTVTLSML